VDIGTCFDAAGLRATDARAEKEDQAAAYALKLSYKEVPDTFLGRSRFSPEEKRQ
jgi:hypothetical protein